MARIVAAVVAILACVLGFGDQEGCLSVPRESSNATAGPDSWPWDRWRPPPPPFCPA